jgi:PAS domain S-box-containing protein
MKQDRDDPGEDTRKANRRVAAPKNKMEEETRMKELIQGILDSSSQPTALIDEEGMIIAFNTSGARQLGYELRDMLGRCIYDFLPSSVREKRRRHFEEVFRTGEPKRFEDQREGRWIESSLHPVKNEAGRTTRILIHGNDITERKRAVLALKESEERFAAFMDNSPSIAWIKDADGRIVYLNKTYEKAFGIGLADCLGKTDDELWPRQTAETFRKNDLEVLDHPGKTIQVTEVTVGSTGRRQYWFCSKFHLSDSAGHKYIGGVGVDMTERKLAKDELSRVVQLLEAHMNNSPMAVIEFDTAYRVTRWSNGATRLFGWTSDEIVGRSIHDFEWVHKEDIEIVDKVAADLRSGKNVSFGTANRNYRKDGSIVCCEWYNSAIHDAKGNLMSILSLALDVTERKKMEEELRRSHDELEQRISERTMELSKSKEELEVKSATLQETNIALKVLLQQIAEDKKDLEDRFASNIRRLVLPYLHKIKKGTLDSRQSACISIIETNLNQIVTPLLQSLAQFGFTPREAQIAALIKDGKTSKEIGEIIGVAPSAIDTYRNKIRRKLKLNNKKINLQTHLQSIK